MPSSPPEPASPVQTRTQQEIPVSNGVRDHDHIGSVEDDAYEDTEREVAAQPARSERDARFEALQLERENLRMEVAQLRQGLEDMARTHEGDVMELQRQMMEAERPPPTPSSDPSEEMTSLREELDRQREQTDSERQAKEHSQEQYRNLLGKVNTIRSQLGERLKADAAELETARERIGVLEESETAAKEENERLQTSISDLNSRLESQDSEIETLRSRTNLSASNWAKERDDLVSREAYLREEYEVARQAMQDWEILATEERSRREVLEERVAEMEDQVNGSREAYERVRTEAEMQSSTVDGLQRALRDLQEERKRELREMVEQSQAQLEELRKKAAAAETSAAELRQQLDQSQKELERTAPFEKEVREKNLLIGKLRHEAVILNDHLTKALRFLKRGRPEDNVDRQLVTNHFLHFLALDRSDPKKFQILQLIAALLGWDESQKEQAGLLRTGAGLGSLRLPTSPFRRTPSTPSLSSDFVPESPGGASRESLAELWSEFLEREAESGGSAGGSRRGSVASGSGPLARGSSLAALRSPSISSQPGGPGGGVTSPTAAPGGRQQSPDAKRKDGGGGTG